MDSLVSVLLPELRAVPPAARMGALRAARSLPFDTFELLGIAVGLIVTALFLRHALDGATGTGARLLAACPVVALSIGPFLLRRMRRGLRHALGRR